MSGAGTAACSHDGTDQRGGRFIVGAWDVIEHADAAACALLGYTRDELIGLHGSELVPLDAHAGTAVSIDRMRRGEITARVGRLRHKDGTVLSIEVAASPLPDGRLLLQVRASRSG